jgi:hypothetical protein
MQTPVMALFIAKTLRIVVEMEKNAAEPGLPKDRFRCCFCDEGKIIS